MIPALTLEPLSWDDLPEAAVLWACLLYTSDAADE